MKKIVISLFLIACSSIANAQLKDWALGVKVGQPTGLNLRKYGDRNAFDLTVGTYGGLLGGTTDYRQGKLKGVGFAINASYLWYAPIMNERLSLYGGLGAQVTSRRYYPNEFAANNAYVKNVGIGPTANIGLEIVSKNTPYSIFFEGGLYAELLPAFLHFSPQLNAGIRYNF